MPKMAFLSEQTKLNLKWLESNFQKINKELKMLMLNLHHCALQSTVRSSHLLPLAFFALLLCLLQISVASDEEQIFSWEPDEYPNLIKTPKFCCPGIKRNPPTNICDPDQLLQPKEANDLDKLLETVGNTTTCMCKLCSNGTRKGLAIKVALLDSISNKANIKSEEERIEHFAERTRSNWNFSPVCQHDVLILISGTSSKKGYIAMGSKAERVIGRSEAKEMIKDAVNHFKYGNYYQGLESIILTIKQKEEQYDPKLDRLGLKSGLLIALGAALASLLVIVIAVWLCIKRDTRRTTKMNNVTKSANGIEQQYEAVKTDS